MTTRAFVFGSILLIVLAVVLALSYSQEMSVVVTKEDTQLFNRLENLYNTIDQNYYDNVELKTLFSGSLNGMLHELDPHSTFIDVSDYALLEEQYRGNYQGIGVSFVMLDDKITVMEVFANGPSDRAGLKMGDQIVEIDGENAVGIDSDEVQRRLRGRGGTKVTVKIERPQHAEKIETTITRGQVPIKSVENEMMLDDKTGYVRVVRFAGPTGNELEGALLRLQAKGMKQLILDLRGNGGGLLPTANNLVDKFLTHKRLIVYTDGQNPSARRAYYSSENGHNWEQPLVILIDHFSASASEIVAGALQDWDRAVIVGDTSFGKGLVQSRFILSDQSSLLLTTSHYYTPTGRLIQRPYKGLDLETYQLQGLDDFDPNSVSGSREINEKKPAYLTASGRSVYGGGGITPDVTVKSEYLFDLFVYALNNQFISFLYGREYYWKHPDIGMDFETYRKEFQVTDEMLSEMLALAKKRNFSYYPRGGKRMDEKAMEAKYWELSDQLKLFLKAELAQFYYGRSYGFTIRRLARDKQLATAMKQFGHAAELADLQKKIPPGYFAERLDNKVAK